jgi:hypothetical protein
MVWIRFLLIAFNVAIVTYLVYRMFRVLVEPMRRGQKIIVLFAGILLLLAPFSFVFGILQLSPVYFLIYPVAISLFLFLIREVR